MLQVTDREKLRVPSCSKDGSERGRKSCVCPFNRAHILPTVADLFRHIEGVHAHDPMPSDPGRTWNAERMSLQEWTSARYSGGSTRGDVEPTARSSRKRTRTQDAVFAEASAAPQPAMNPFDAALRDGLAPANTGEAEEETRPSDAQVVATSTTLPGAPTVQPVDVGEQYHEQGILAIPADDAQQQLQCQQPTPPHALQLEDAVLIPSHLPLALMLQVLHHDGALKEDAVREACQRFGSIRCVTLLTNSPCAVVEFGSIVEGTSTADVIAACRYALKNEVVLKVMMM